MNVISKTPDIHQREYFAFPTSLPEFQRLFPHDAACAAYLEQIRWEQGFECPHCHQTGEPYRFATRAGVLRCRKCRRDVALTAGTVMQRTHTPLTTWFWGAYLVATMTPGMSAKQFQRQLGLRYETAFQILHKLRAGMIRADREQIGGARPKDYVEHVEVDVTRIGEATHGERRRVHDRTLVVAAVEVCQQKPKESDALPRRGDRRAGRLRLEVVPNRDAKTLCGFVEATIEPETIVVTNDCPDYATLTDRHYQHHPVLEGGKSEPMVRVVFRNLKSWLRGTHHGVSPQHLQAYLNEFSFRFNRRSDPFGAFPSLLGIGTNGEGPTYDGLYSGEWNHLGA